MRVSVKKGDGVKESCTCVCMCVCLCISKFLKAKDRGRMCVRPVREEKGNTTVNRSGRGEGTIGRARLKKKEEKGREGTQELEDVGREERREGESAKGRKKP